MKILRTKLAITVKCKCGGVIAATMIYGGDTIDKDFTMTMAESYNDGGKIELINTDETPVRLQGCSCS